MDYDTSELEELKDELVENIREYSLSQKEEWQKIPMLALEAEGRTGYSDTRSRAYTQGFWALEPATRNGKYQAYVDLATGEIVDAWSSQVGPVPTTELEYSVIDYVEENEPEGLGKVKEDVEERTNEERKKVHDAVMRLQRAGDLQVGVEWDVNTPDYKVVPASDEVVLMLADDLEALDASGIVEMLESKAEEPIGDYYDYTEEQLEGRHIKKAELLGLSERYSRG